MESYSKPERNPHLTELINNINEALQDSISIKEIGDTFEIEANDLSLSFTLFDHTFEIRNIDTRGKSGTGRKVIETIHDFADKNNYEVIASNVVDTARGFWEKMGYQEGSEDGEFFRTS